MIAPRADERPAAHRDLPPPPAFCRGAQLTDRGVVLGEGVVVAPMTRRGDGTAALAVEGREAEIFALLSLAQGGAVHPNVLHGVHGVAKSVAQGEFAGAAIRLAQIGLPPLRGPRDAEMLKAGATCLDKGFSPWTILQAAEIEGANVRLCKAEWDETQHPRDPATGRFTETGGAAAIPASVAEHLIAGGAMQVAAGVYALAGGALLSLTAAGWVLSHGPKAIFKMARAIGCPASRRTMRLTRTARARRRISATTAGQGWIGMATNSGRTQTIRLLTEADVPPKRPTREFLDQHLKIRVAVRNVLMDLTESR
jgi:hypothetical protein